MNKLKVLDLFSGIGGFSLGLERTNGFETVAFCEIDPFCQKVLKKHWPDVPIFNDVRTLNYDGAVDVITGGFPCQPFSVAGNQEGENDDRHLWPAMFSLVQKYRPAWVIGENVAGIINMALDNVLSDLGGEGYATRSFVIPACAIGANHRRDRVWILGYSEHNGQPTSAQLGITRETDDRGEKGAHENSEPARPVGARQGMVADPASLRLQGRLDEWARKRIKALFKTTRRWHLPASRVCGGHDGIPDRAHRLKALGNAVVPQIPEIIGHAILAAEAA